MLNLFGFGSAALSVSFALQNDNERVHRSIQLSSDGDQDKPYIPVYHDGEDLVGVVSISLKKTGSRVEHQGIRVEFIGQIEINPDKNIVSASSSGGSSIHEFVALSKLLAYPGELSQSASFDFAFVSAEKPFESYYGTNARLRYFLRLTVQKRFSSTVVEHDIYVESPIAATNTIAGTEVESEETNDVDRRHASKPIEMEVGIEDCLSSSTLTVDVLFETEDAIVGKIYFSLIRIKVKYMEIALVRKETVGSTVSSSGVYTDSDVLAHYEILDGAPSKGETVPIRMFLAPFDNLTPTMRDVQNKFSVQYYLNLVLVDEDDRRYFKQQEIILWRKAESEFLQPNESIHQIPKLMDKKIDSEKTIVVAQ